MTSIALRWTDEAGQECPASLLSCCGSFSKALQTKFRECSPRNARNPRKKSIAAIPHDSVSFRDFRGHSVSWVQRFFKNAIRSAISSFVIAASRPTGIRDMPVEMRDFTSALGTVTVIPPGTRRVMAAASSPWTSPARMRPSVVSIVCEIQRSSRARFGSRISVRRASAGLIFTSFSDGPTSAPLPPTW